MLSLHTDLARALDGVTFAHAAGLTPDPWQVRLLRSPAQHIILNCSRQAGKSTSTALLALQSALYIPQSLILLLAPALRQSQELFRKVKAHATALQLPTSVIAEESALRLEVTGGGRIVCLPGKESTIRGFSAVTLLLVDEASRVSDELYRAVRPMLAVSGGRLVLLSSPFGKRGFFYETWAHGGPQWERIEVPAPQVPRIPATFLAEERRALGPWFAQEYLCQFVDTEFQLYATADIDAAVCHDLVPLRLGGCS